MGTFGDHYIVTLGQGADSSAVSLCLGDSGGPLLRGAIGSTKLIGINSTGISNPRRLDGIYTHNVHTRLMSAALAKWIKYITGQQVPPIVPPAPENVNVVSAGGGAARISWQLMPPGVDGQFVITPSGDIPVVPGLTSVVDSNSNLGEGEAVDYSVCFVHFAIQQCTTVHYVHHMTPPPFVRRPAAATNVKANLGQPGKLVLSWDGALAPVFSEATGWIAQVREVSPEFRDWNGTPVLLPTARSAELLITSTHQYDFRVCAISSNGFTNCTEAAHDIPSLPMGTVPLVGDGGFEVQHQGAPTGSWSSPGATPAQAVRGTDVGHTGVEALSLVPGQALAGVEQTLAVEPGHDYVLSLWLRGDVPAWIGVRHADATRPAPIAAQQAEPQPQPWKLFSVPFSVGSDESQVIVFARGYSATLAPGSSLLLDDVSVHESALCLPLTCAETSACGQVPDACGGTIDCGPCPAPSTDLALPATGSEQCNGIGEASYEPVLAVLARAHHETVLLGHDGDAALASIDEVAKALAESAVWMRDQGLDASNPSLAASMEWTLNDQDAKLLEAAQGLARLGARARAAQAQVHAAALLGDALAAQAGRCFLDKYDRLPDSWWDWTAGRQPETAATPPPPLPTGCAGLDAAALAPFDDWLASTVAREQEALALFGGETQATYAQTDLGYAQEARGVIEGLRAFVQDPGDASPGELALRFQDALRTVARDLLVGAQNATYIGTDLPGPSRYAFESDVEAAHRATQLAALAGACAAER